MDIKFAAIYIIIPTLLIVLAIMFKLTVNRNINKIVFQILLLELPTEIIFLAISFIVSYILYGLDSSFANISDLDSVSFQVVIGFFLFMVYIVVAFIIFALCRYTVRSFESKKISAFWYGFCATLSYAFALGAYVISIYAFGKGVLTL